MALLTQERYIHCLEALGDRTAKIKKLFPEGYNLNVLNPFLRYVGKKFWPLYFNTEGIEIRGSNENQVSRLTAAIGLIKKKRPWALKFIRRDEILVLGMAIKSTGGTDNGPILFLGRLQLNTSDEHTAYYIYYWVLVRKLRKSKRPMELAAVLVQRFYQSLLNDRPPSA